MYPDKISQDITPQYKLPQDAKCKEGQNVQLGSLSHYLQVYASTHARTHGYEVMYSIGVFPWNPAFK